MPKKLKYMSESPNIYLDTPDALSAILSRLQLQAEVYVNGDFCGDWGVDTSGSRRIPFHLLGRGQAWLHMEGSSEQMLTSGDLVIFPHDHQHVVAGSPELPPKERINAEISEQDGPITNMVCGFFEFQNKAAWPLLDSLPSVIVLDLGDQSASPVVRTLIELMIAELDREQPGYYAVINQLAALLFVQVIRQQIRGGQLETGLLAALFDGKISKALAAMHNHPEQSWTLEQLAQQATMGRSSFAQRFHELVGTPAMQYLAAWRMREARLLLKTSNYSMADIAERSGYESEAAFRKAYKKIVGETPGATRRQAKQRT